MIRKNKAEHDKFWLRLLSFCKILYMKNVNEKSGRCDNNLWLYFINSNCICSKLMLFWISVASSLQIRYVTYLFGTWNIAITIFKNCWWWNHNLDIKLTIVTFTLKSSNVYIVIMIVTNNKSLISSLTYLWIYDIYGKWKRIAWLIFIMLFGNWNDW